MSHIPHFSALRDFVNPAENFSKRALYGPGSVFGTAIDTMQEEERNKQKDTERVMAAMAESERNKVKDAQWQKDFNLKQANANRTAKALKKAEDTLLAQYDALRNTGGDVEKQTKIAGSLTPDEQKALAEGRQNLVARLAEMQQAPAFDGRVSPDGIPLRAGENMNTKDNPYLSRTFQDPGDLLSGTTPKGPGQDALLYGDARQKEIEQRKADLALYDQQMAKAANDIKTVRPETKVDMVAPTPEQHLDALDKYIATNRGNLTDVQLLGAVQARNALNDSILKSKTEAKKMNDKILESVATHAGKKAWDIEHGVVDGTKKETRNGVSADVYKHASKELAKLRGKAGLLFDGLSSEEEKLADSYQKIVDKWNKGY